MAVDHEAWRLTVDARIAALESALAALAVIKGMDARHALAAALEKAAASAPPERDPAHHAAMQVALRALADTLRLPDRATDA
jgi:hypothetical protein